MVAAFLIFISSPTKSSGRVKASLPASWSPWPGSWGCEVLLKSISVLHGGGGGGGIFPTQLSWQRLRLGGFCQRKFCFWINGEMEGKEQREDFCHP